MAELFKKKNKVNYQRRAGNCGLPVLACVPHKSLPKQLHLEEYTHDLPRHSSRGMARAGHRFRNWVGEILCVY